MTPKPIPPRPGQFEWYRMALARRMHEQGKPAAEIRKVLAAVRAKSDARKEKAT